MPSLVIVGAQWGDEGKGKLVDRLAEEAGWVVRFHGGNNAGHTLVVNGKKTKLSLIPSGVLHPKVKCVLGAGVVLSPEVFADEINGLRANGVEISPERLIVDRDAHLITRYHILIDRAREEALGSKRIGTTGRGIGPTYEDRAGRCGVRVIDLLYLNEIKESFRATVEHKNEYLTKVYGRVEHLSFAEEWEWLQRAAETIAPFIGNASAVIDSALVRNERVVFEGAQATLLDQSFGTVPYVTSSHTLAGAVTTGVGIGPKRIDFVLGVAKAYCTRVGSGPFPTELHDKLGDLLRERGGEFGTVTGRPRRCGWCDAVALRRAARLNGFDALAITKLDVLSGLEKIKLCTGYTLNGKLIDDVPAHSAEFDRVVPVYTEFDGWQEDLSAVRDINALPKQARVFLESLSEITGCMIALVSVGPDRSQALVFDAKATTEKVREWLR